MNTTEDQFARVKAINEGLNSAVPGRGRMAGATMSAFLAPGIMGLIDNQETGLLNNVGAGLLMGSGITAGGILGQHSAQRGASNAGMQDILAKAKAEAAVIANEQGVAAGQAHFAKAKEAYVNDARTPITIDLGNNVKAQTEATPMQLRRGGRGAMLGALAAALPAYLMMRNGEVA